MASITSTTHPAEYILDPLPFRIQPSTPRPSFTTCLQQSTYLFPSVLRTMSSNLSSSNDGNTNANINNANINIATTPIKSNERKRSNLKSSNFNLKNSSNKENSSSTKKTVTWSYICYSPSPIANLNPEDVSSVWYTQEQHNGLKFDAASSAGVKLELPFITNEGNRQKFVMVGDFDEEDGDTSVDTNAATSGSKNGTNSKDFNTTVTNENEYKDFTNNKGEEVCKRGLGFHFSRSRKRNRAWVRSMVLASQKAIRGREKKSGKQDQQQQHQLLSRSTLLAMISTKCSKNARESAKWRGMMDCKAAYPEDGAKGKKRSGRSNDTSIVHSHKKQRSGSRKGYQGQGAVGVSTFGYLSKALEVPV